MGNDETTTEQTKRKRGRPTKDGRMVQTAVRLPVETLEFYRRFDNASDHMRRALEEYRDRHNDQHND